MEAILNWRSEDFENYYGLLGCDELSTTEQIVNEFKVKALACHPDKHPENPKAVEEFQKLHEAKEVLTDEKKRKSYDLWLRSQIQIPFSEWQALSDSVKTSMHWAVRAKKEPMLEAPKDTNTMSSRNQVSPSDRQTTEEEKPTDESLPSSDYWHNRFRWAGEAPSGLLQKFRNYEI
ncbi:dnaJ homolog subfamily C member 12 [Xyrauchen texanus]|uniref:dnaJ homolog subfamily C member 12 n=1 Tax=Xyrauchen texanus TaxID=154827 RepID=UPI0022427272|nr:dnaJ homolog subfamily C member 12 [Xyrauchen texanus]